MLSLLGFGAYFDGQWSMVVYVVTAQSFQMSSGPFFEGELVPESKLSPRIGQMETVWELGRRVNF